MATVSSRVWTKFANSEVELRRVGGMNAPVGSRDPVYNSLCCWAFEVGDKWRHNDAIVEKVINIDQNSRAVKPLCSVSKLSTEPIVSRRELVANCVHTADATRQLRRVGVSGVYQTRYCGLVCSLVRLQRQAGSRRQCGIESTWRRWRPKALLLFARYRSIWDQCKKKYIGPILTTDRRPITTDLSIFKNSNGHISARGRPIHFMFGSTVGFTASADRIALFPLWSNSIGMWENNARGVGLIRLVTI